MSVFFWLILIITAYKAEVCKDGYFADYISPKSIQPIKGIFTLLIFMSHFVTYVDLGGAWNAPYFQIRKWLGQLVVVPFLFYSGYGVAESIRRDERDYVKRMPKNRILKVLFQFDLAILLFLLLRYAKGSTYSISHILAAFLGWEGIGNSNWYVLAILYLYLVTWLSYTIFRKRKLLPILSVTLLTGIYIVYMKLIADRPEYYCNTVMAYVAGMVFSYKREEFEKIVFSGYWYFVILGTVVIVMQFLHGYWGKILIYQLVSVLFAIAMVLLTAKIRINSKFLSYCGEHLFSLFILQRLPMMALNETPIKQYPYLYFAVCLAVTFLLSMVFDRITPKLWKAVFGR